MQSEHPVVCYVCVIHAKGVDVGADCLSHNNQSVLPWPSCSLLQFYIFFSSHTAELQYLFFLDLMLLSVLSFNKNK